MTQQDLIHKLLEEKFKNYNGYSKYCECGFYYRDKDGIIRNIYNGIEIYNSIMYFEQINGKIRNVKVDGSEYNNNILKCRVVNCGFSNVDGVNKMVINLFDMNARKEFKIIDCGTHYELTRSNP